MSNKQLRIPQGTEAFYLEEAFRHRQLLRSFEDLCSSWAYLPVQTPVFDFHDLYRDLSDQNSSYRLVDRDGDILVLRSDITLFLARQMGMTVQPEDLPVRVYYGDTILRHEDPDDLSKNEFFQVGAELIGATGAEADAEIILLLLEAADTLGARNTVLHLGSRQLMQSTTSEQRFFGAIESRQFSIAREILMREGSSEERAESLLTLYRFIGPADDLRRLADNSGGLNESERAAIEHTLAVADLVASLGHSERIRVDLSEVGDRNYYSGIVFHLYDEDAAAPLAAGGRYDDLLGRFGAGAPSVGFSLMLRRLQSSLTADQLPEIPAPVDAGQGSFAERFRAGAQLRQKGKVVRL